MCKTVTKKTKILFWVAEQQGDKQAPNFCTPTVNSNVHPSVTTHISYQPKQVHLLSHLRGLMLGDGGEETEGTKHFFTGCFPPLYYQEPC